ncbi:hypothetical protein PF010_g15006 [Phytophthora fragariae]|uniref:Protein kinase domain-containing protein n=1 Tax=Phytophthora fragariae TaxID=53985 RepID=A0A6G0KV70_9STRA|nr:hypothetical protein PF010_g15006 [Phytophthora fragariae]KAE9216724.1 hypothetical protein PF004_g14376 [Phytophthora fragariae]
MTSEEQQPLLASVQVVCREAPTLMVEPQLVRRIEAFLDYSSQYWLHKASRDLPLRLVKRVFARKQWDRDDVVYSIGQAAFEGKLDVIQWLCAQPDESGNAQTRELLTKDNPLSAAAYYGHLEVMKWFVENGAQVNQSDDEGSPALMSAAGRGHFAAVQWLVEQGAHFNEDGEGDAPLHGAATFGSLDIVKYLVKKGARVDGKNEGGKSALHYAAGAAEECVELVQFLLDNGLNPSDTDELGRTALYYASTAQNFGVVEVLLKSGFQVNRPPEADLSRAYLEAAKGDRLSLVEHLVEYGVDVHYTNFQGRNALHEAAGTGSVSVVSALLGRGVDLHQTDKFGVTPVLEASRHGRLEVLRHLLEAGGSISDANIAGQTALHLSALGGHKDVCELLLECGAEVNCCDKRGWTPLHSAATAGHTDVVQFLITSGASVGTENTSGQTAQALAEERGHDDVVKCLSERSNTAGNQNASDPFAEYKEHLLHSAEVHFNSIATTVQDSSEGSWLDSPIEVRLKKQKWNSKGFLETLKQWSRLNHPHIVKLYGFSHSDNSSKEPYFVCEATTQLLTTEANLRSLWDIVYQAALGLQYLHDRNIVHGTLYLGSIVISSSGVAKIAVFDGCFDTYLPWCTAPEILVGLPASFDSDVYVFGLVIVDVISGRGMWKFKDNNETQDAILSGELLSKPNNMTPQQWDLIERMCCYNPADRLSMTDVVRELETLTKNHSMDQDAGFKDSAEHHDWLNAIDDQVAEVTLPCLDIGHARVGESTVSRLLTEIDAMCKGPMTIDSMNRDVYDRLTDIFNQLQAQDPPDNHIIQQYGNIVRYFHMRLETTSSVGSSQAARCAASRQGADDTFSVHGDIDRFIASAGLSEPTPVHQWRDQWESRRRQQQHEMLQKLENLSEDVEDDNEREEALTYLRFELSKHPTSYATSKVGDFTRAKSTITALSSLKNPNWFIPAHEVQFDKFDEFSRGGFGKVYHGKWKRSEVVVKKVKLKTEEDKAAFLNEVEVWHKLYHPNVVRLYGACHVQRAFFVCEYAGNGQLDNYLRTHQDEVWQKLFEAALGLRYLHVKRIVHGDLKCNNILIGSDGSAKLTDFGLSTVESNTTECTSEPECETESACGAQVSVGAIRWKAPEVLRGEKSTFASDIYSFGMCILEAASGSYPWGMTKDPVVRYFVLKKQQIPNRPEKCCEAAYALVQQMCHFDPSKRLGINAVVEALKALR